MPYPINQRAHQFNSIQSVPVSFGLWDTALKFLSPGPRNDVTDHLGVVIHHQYGISALVSQKKKNKNKNKTKLKKKKKNWEKSRGVASFSAQANINWTLHVLSHAPANSRWRSDGQILDLKQHVHGVV